jgi:uncharacterized DUF497 family protein
MAIVWDERKRLLNVRKHGLDFALVEDAFDFAGALYAAANDDRTKAVGQFEDRLSVLIFQQLGDEAISLVSLRVASKKEREAYANQI